ncbi:MAG TPA: hypothetical protein VIC53_08170 [Wenzhouxiangella sp.]
MPSMRARFIIILIALLISAFVFSNADDSSAEGPNQDPIEEASDPAVDPAIDPPMDPRMALYENTSPLWQARIRAYCGHYSGNEEPDLVCLGETLGALVTAIERQKQTDEERRKNPVPETFWQDIDRLSKALARTIPFHPLCIDKLPMAPLSESDLDGRTATCDNAQTGHITVRESGWFLSSHPLDEEGFSQGWAGYRIVESTPAEIGGKDLWIEAVQNTGGTGNFDRIWQIHLPAQEGIDETRFEAIQTVAGGDRCNDGKGTIENIQPGLITYNHAATPYRLLNPDLEDDAFFQYIIRMMEEESNPPEEGSPLGQLASESPDQPFMNWLAYDDVVSCAICCAGKITKTVDLDTGESWLEGITIDPDLFEIDFFARSDLAECGAPWLASLQDMAPENGPITFFLDEWLAKRDELRGACEGVGP